MGYYVRYYGLLLFSVAVILTPLCVIAVGVRARQLRRQGRSMWLAPVQVGAAAATLLVLVVVWQPGMTDPYGGWHRDVEWLPFQDLTDTHVRQIWSNVLLMTPVGVLVAVTARSRWWLVAFPAAVEAVQWAAIPGRVGSVEDVLLGTLGAAVGLFISLSIRTLGTGAVVPTTGHAFRRTRLQAEAAYVEQEN